MSAVITKPNNAPIIESAPITAPVRPQAARVRSARPVALHRAVAPVRVHRAVQGPTVQRIRPVLGPHRIQKVQRLVRKAIDPFDGDTCYALECNQGWRVGATWTNWGDTPFFLASDPHISYAIEEWAQAQWETGCDDIATHEGEPIFVPFQQGVVVKPTAEQLISAWDTLTNDNPDHTLTLTTYDRNGLPMGVTEMRAVDVCAAHGYGADDIIPALIVADRVRPEHLAALERDEEVFLDGYRVTQVEQDGDITTVHIETNQEKEN